MDKEITKWNALEIPFDKKNITANNCLAETLGTDHGCDAMLLYTYWFAAVSV